MNFYNVRVSSIRVAMLQRTPNHDPANLQNFLLTNKYDQNDSTMYSNSQPLPDHQLFENSIVSHDSVPYLARVKAFHVRPLK